MLSCTIILAALGAAGVMDAESAPPAPLACPGEWLARIDPSRGFGMIGDGWDGPGQNATTVFFHVENFAPTRGSRQREQLIEMFEAWAEHVQVHFVEIPIKNQPRSIDFLWAEGDHCALEQDECGQPGCVFNEEGPLGHAAYPPGVETICGGISMGSRAGNIHLNIDPPIQTNPENAGYSFRLVVAHMIGHALGLQDNPNPGDHNVMGPIEWNENFLLISAADAAQIQDGYAAGQGSVTTLETLGVWVNSAWTGQELGTPGSPFDTLAEGVAGVPPYGDGVTVHVQAGLYPESLVISTPCIIQSEFGAAYIGQ